MLSPKPHEIMLPTPIVSEVHQPLHSSEEDFMKEWQQLTSARNAVHTVTEVLDGSRAALDGEYVSHLQNDVLGSSPPTQLTSQLHCNNLQKLKWETVRIHVVNNLDSCPDCLQQWRRLKAAFIGVVGICQPSPNQYKCVMKCPEASAWRIACQNRFQWKLQIPIRSRIACIIKRFKSSC